MYRRGWAAPGFVLSLVLAAFPVLLHAQVGLEGLLDRALAMEAGRDWEGLRGIAEAGLGVVGDSADLRYFAARAAVELGEGAAAALPELDAALASGRFIRVSPSGARLLRARLLADTLRFEAALRDLALADPLAPETPLLRARIYYSQGAAEKARAELRPAAQRFSEDPRFARLFLERESAVPDQGSRSLAEYFLGRLSRLAAGDPELTFLAVPFYPDRRRQLDSLRAFRASGTAHPHATALSAELGLLAPDLAIAEFFRAAPRFERTTFERFVRFILASGDQANASLLYSELGRFSGALWTDRNGDGLAEEEARYQAGRLVSWRGDADQDGRDEVELRFATGHPSAALVARGDFSAELAYGEYPELLAARYRPRSTPGLLGTPPPADASEPSAWSYSFPPQSLAFQPVALKAFPGPDSTFILPTGVASVLPPSEREALLAADRMERGSSGGLERVDLAVGMPLRKEHRDAQGQLRSELRYEGGRPVFERLDQDGDGRFETERGYALQDGAAVPSFARFDFDGDGAYEYRESLSFPFRKEWDYDGDGRVDAAELRESDGGRIRELASSWGGALDERFRFDPAGRLISAERGGRKLELIADANPRLRWIGSKPFDLGSNLPATEGLYRYMNLRYRLVFVGTEGFAELLP